MPVCRRVVKDEFMSGFSLSAPYLSRTCAVYPLMILYVHPIKSLPSPGTFILYLLYMKYFQPAIVFALFMLCLQSCSAQTNTPSPFDTTIYGRNDKAGKYVNIRGFKMYYETYGSGQPLLIIHGNGGSINNFMYQIPYFSKDYKVIVADSRAQGKSVDNSDTLSYEMMTDDLNALLDALHIDSAYVIGWSDGGINGLLLAIRHPDKVKKLAVTGANLWPDTTAVNPIIYNQAMHLNDSLAQPATNARDKARPKAGALIIL